MAEPDRLRSPFAGVADLSTQTPVRVLSPDEIERMLAEHRLYLEMGYHRGRGGPAVCSGCQNLGDTKAFAPAPSRLGREIPPVPTCHEMRTGDHHTHPRSPKTIV
jgi:hypothetical protein